MQQAQRKSMARRRRHARVRRHVRGTAERPRLVVFRSNAGIYAQLIDDREGHTLAAASTLESEVQSASSGAGEHEGKSARARAVGARIAERAAAVGITKVVFDRGGNRYHGRVRALAEAAREGGLQF